MKKTSLSAIILSFLLLCSCTGQPAPTSSAPPPQTEQGAAATGVSYEPFQMIQPREIGLYGSGNSQGFYEVLDNPDRSKNVLFTDYAAKQQVYLCAQPNCDHASSSCPAWIPSAEMYMDVQIVATEQELFWTYSGPSIAARIEKSNLSGAEKTLIYEFPANVTLSPGLAWNGAQLAVFGTSYTGQENGDVTVQSALYVIDVSNKTCTPIQILDSSAQAVYDPGAETLHFLGTTETGFIIKKITNGVFDYNEETGESAEITPTRHTVYKIPFDGSEAKTLLEHEQDEIWEKMWDGDLYILSSHGEGKYSLSRMDGVTGETTVIVDDFASHPGGEVIAGSDFRCIYFVTEFGGTVIVSALASERITEKGDYEKIYQDFAISTQDGSITPLTLSNYYHATGMPIQILAEVGDSLYVQAEVKELPADGLYSVPSLARRMALISKEDYLHSVPNYTYVNTIRER